MAATLELAISAIRSGRIEEGRQLLNLLIQENPNNAKAWLWMSSVVNTDEQRARCLYHVLAIDPNSELARRGLNVLGIVVSDSRPVKIPRDSKPIQIPKPTPVDQERRPFLINPQAIADELPFTPVTAPFAEKVEASPSVLSIDVENEAAGQNEKDVSQESEAQPHAAQPESSQNPSQPVSIAASTQTKDTDTQPLPGQSQQHPSEPVPVVSSNQAQGVASQPVMPTTQLQNPSEPVPVVPADQAQGVASQPLAPTAQPQNPSGPVPVQNPQYPGVVSPPQNNPVQFQSGTQMQTSNPPNMAPPSDQYAQSFAHQSQPVVNANQQPINQPAQDVSVPNQTRPSQPVPVVGSNPNMGMPPAGQVPSNPMLFQGVAGQANVTMGMPTQQPQSPSHPVPPPIHSNTTMGMPVPAQNQQLQHPSEPVPVTPLSNPMGLTPYGQPQMPPPPSMAALHSSSTMMMPSLPDIGARTQLAASQPIPTANPNFAYQPGMMGDPMVNAYASMHGGGMEGREQEEQGVNILAVIIFGTLSVTALGGLGMLILLAFTAPPA